MWRNLSSPLVRFIRRGIKAPGWESPQSSHHKLPPCGWATMEGNFNPSQATPVMLWGTEMSSPQRTLPKLHMYIYIYFFFSKMKLLLFYVSKLWVVCLVVSHRQPEYSWINAYLSDWNQSWLSWPNKLHDYTLYKKIYRKCEFSYPEFLPEEKWNNTKSVSSTCQWNVCKKHCSNFSYVFHKLKGEHSCHKMMSDLDSPLSCHDRASYE